MIIPIKCFTCGNVLADKYRYFVEKTREKKKENNMDEDGVIYLTKENTSKTIEGKIMDDLGFTRLCCRRHILTHVDIE
tara:strand:- start:964 stop:1197 length:234 start_codon:yes stop_codon:yes gene_type:complete